MSRIGQYLGHLKGYERSNFVYGHSLGIQWSKFSSEKIHEKYVIPLLSDLSEVDMCDLIVSKTAADKLSQMLIYNSLSLVSSVPSTRKKRPVRR